MQSRYGYSRGPSRGYSEYPPQPEAIVMMPNHPGNQSAKKGNCCCIASVVIGTVVLLLGALTLWYFLMYLPSKKKEEQGNKHSNKDDKKQNTLDGVFTWQFQDRDGKWKSYDSASSKEIEASFQKFRETKTTQVAKISVSTSVGELKFEVEITSDKPLKAGKQYSLVYDKISGSHSGERSSVSRDVRRWDKVVVKPQTGKINVKITPARDARWEFEESQGSGKWKPFRDACQKTLDAQSKKAAKIFDMDIQYGRTDVSDHNKFRIVTVDLTKKTQTSKTNSGENGVTRNIRHVANKPKKAICQHGGST